MLKKTPTINRTTMTAIPTPSKNVRVLLLIDEVASNLELLFAYVGKVKIIIENRNAKAAKAVRLPMRSECEYLALEKIAMKEMQSKLIEKGK